MDEVLAKLVVFLVLLEVEFGLLASLVCGSLAWYGMILVSDGTIPDSLLGEASGTAGLLGRGKLMSVCVSSCSDCVSVGVTMTVGCDSSVVGGVVSVDSCCWTGSAP